jgi:hypothetical protein
MHLLCFSPSPATQHFFFPFRDERTASENAIFHDGGRNARQRNRYVSRAIAPSSFAVCAVVFKQTHANVLALPSRTFDARVAACRRPTTTTFFDSTIASQATKAA